MRVPSQPPRDKPGSPQVPQRQGEETHQGASEEPLLHPRSRSGRSDTGSPRQVPTPGVGVAQRKKTFCPRALKLLVSE